MPKLDKQDQRIADIFGTEDVRDVTDETLLDDYAIWFTTWGD